jgi:hypothetical protein
VVDAEHDHHVLLVVDLVDHSVGTTSGGVEPGELALETPADTMRVLDERGQHELHDRSRGALGQSFELSLNGTGDPQLVRVGRIRHGEVNRARNSSPVM